MNEVRLIQMNEVSSSMSKVTTFAERWAHGHTRDPLPTLRKAPRVLFRHFGLVWASKPFVLPASRFVLRLFPMPPFPDRPDHFDHTPLTLWHLLPANDRQLRSGLSSFFPYIYRR